MVDGILSPAFLRAAGRAGKGGKNFITFRGSDEDPAIYKLSCVGFIKVKSVKNGDTITQTYSDLSDTQISIQADANTDVQIIGEVTKFVLSGFWQGSYKGYTKATNINVSNMPMLESLGIPYNTGITELNVSNNTALTSLYCGSTSITELDLSANTMLTELDCSDTGITELNVSNNTALTSLYCGSTSITELDLSANTMLTKLDCRNTGITELNVSNNTALTSLYCGSTSITELDLSANTMLTELDCSDTNIEELNLSENTAIQQLNCSQTSIDSLDLTPLSELMYLNCSQTNISELNLSNCNDIAQTNLVGCSDLTVLYYNASNENVSDKIAEAITNATADNGTVYTDSEGAYYSTIADAATAKGWTIEQL